MGLFDDRLLERHNDDGTVTMRAVDPDGSVIVEVTGAGGTLIPTTVWKLGGALFDEADRLRKRAAELDAMGSEAMAKIRYPKGGPTHEE